MNARFAVSVLGSFLLVAAPTGVAGSLIFGTEDLPELWGDGTVSYHPTSPPPNDHDYLAINRSWLDADNATDRLTLHLRVIDTNNLEANRDGWWIGCALNADILLDSEPTGLRVLWHFNLYSADPVNGRSEENATRIWKVGTPLVGVGSTGTVNSTRFVATHFGIIVGEPGYYTWTVPRHVIQEYGTELANLQASCSEQLGRGGASVTPFWQNRDNATSRSIYSLLENRRVAGPEGALDPIEEFERQNATPSPTVASTQKQDSTSGVGVAAGLLVVAAIAAVRRQQQ